jgi:VIT1/CCC1 family predicted Fe2+/Mn2+ transporter
MSEEELREPPSIARVSDVTEQQERSMYGGAQPQKPNSLFLPFGKLGHISWQSESGTPVLALLMLLVILISMIVAIVISAFSSSSAGATAISALGQALLAIVGAVIGSSGRERR